MEKAESLLADLDPEQRKAVTAQKAIQSLTLGVLVDSKSSYLPTRFKLGKLWDFPFQWENQ